MSARFVDALHCGRVILMDGAMGTEILRAGARQGESLEAWNLTHPDRVRAIHQAYLDAGATCLVANTFQASRALLRGKGVGDGDWRRINEQGIELARSVGDGRHFVLASIGPPPDWRGGQGTDAAAEECLRQIELLASADGILLETQSRVDFMAAVIRQAHRITPSTPLLVSFSYGERRDEAVATPNQALADEAGVFAQAEREHVAALGVNCGRDVGLDDVIRIIRCYREKTELPLFARPNAGSPTRSASGWVYPLSPQALAERLPDLLTAGVRMVGGCCGTTPAHIAAMRPIVDKWNARVSTIGEPPA